MLKKRFSKLNDAFDADHVNFWSPTEPAEQSDGDCKHQHVFSYRTGDKGLFFSPSIRWRVQVSWGWALSSQQPLSGTYGIIGHF